MGHLCAAERIHTYRRQVITQTLGNFTLTFGKQYAAEVQTNVFSNLAPRTGGIVLSNANMTLHHREYQDRTLRTKIGNL
jgi:hypothetical protein